MGQNQALADPADEQPMIVSAPTAMPPESSAGAADGLTARAAGLAPAARLAMLDAAADEHVADQRPDTTKYGYERDWVAWTAYTTALGIPDTSASRGALVGYVVHLERAGQAPASIDRRLAGAVVGLREHGVEPTREAQRAARTALNGYRRRLAEAGEKRGRGKAPALTVAHLRRICLACPDTLAGVRDRALVLLAFGIAGRRSEVAGLLVDDLQPDEQGLVVTVRFGKTGARTVAVPYGSNLATCPVRAWRAWLAAAGHTDGAALRRVDRHGRLLGGMSGQAVGEVITRAGERAGIAIHFTGHSPRSGLATESRRAGHDNTAIEKQGGWVPGSRAVGGYMQIVDRWADNAVAGIGL